MSTFSAINVASQALQAFQQALNVTGTNLANANPPGYSRESVTLGQEQSNPYLTINGTTQWAGNGVTVATINRMSNMFLTAQSQRSATNLGQTGAQLSGSQQVQSLFPDASGSGISNDITQFYNSWSSLASEPNGANLQAVQQAGIALTTDVRNTYSSLQQLQAQANQQTTSTIGQIQSIANTIGQLNIQIQQESAGGGQPNALLDQRDQAVQQLSSLVGVTTSTAPSGAISVNVGEFDLVDSAGAHQFPTTFNAANGTVSSGADVYPISGGQLAGNFANLNSISSTMGSLDTLANTMTTQVNSLMSTGTTANGTTGQNFFNAASTGAVNFNLDPAVLADPNIIATGISGNTGDTGLAQNIANEQNTTVAGLGNMTTSNFYNSLVSNVGQAVATNTTTLSTQQAVDTQIQNQIQSVSGVSVDEEMSNMLVYQSSYQAAAKALTIANTVLGDLLGLIQ